ncbi:class I SAM-dependent methyltransferase [Desulfosarcina cetonica]|uniref:class I SAM-dependent methyltransferase n=1 Tax=Desulfosarcina cetonica TaxID=90730 RepID=UPI0006D271EB|nr:class I SAM-dependent methyltransferase [Desulfosarcina cetonica]
MNVSRYDERARGLNACMYAYYAQHIKASTGVTRGVCLDAGCGGGYLGLALAKITDLNLIFLDVSSAMLEKADAHIVEDGLQGKARTLLGDVHRIPLEDGSVNLVISRGSIPFWKDPEIALKEVYRVLAPGGKAFVGGGRGTPEIQAQIAAAMQARGIEPSRDRQRRDGPCNRMMKRDYNEILQKSGIPQFHVTKGDDGMWIQMEKFKEKP